MTIEKTFHTIPKDTLMTLVLLLKDLSSPAPQFFSPAARNVPPRMSSLSPAMAPFQRLFAPALARFLTWAFLASSKHLLVFKSCASRGLFAARLGFCSLSLRPSSVSRRHSCFSFDPIPFRFGYELKCRSASVGEAVSLPPFLKCFGRV